METHKIDIGHQLFSNDDDDDDDALLDKDYPNMDIDHPLVSDDDEGDELLKNDDDENFIDQQLLFELSAHSATGDSPGVWSSWSQWSNCSSECDGGYSVRSRTCLMVSDDAYCEGELWQILFCNTLSCPGK